MSGQGIDAIDWAPVRGELDARGSAVLPGLLDEAECETITALYGCGDIFRGHVTMARHGFGQGEYRYFAYPLPPSVAHLRAALYPCLAPECAFYERS